MVCSWRGVSCWDTTRRVEHWESLLMSERLVCTAMCAYVWWFGCGSVCEWMLIGVYVHVVDYTIMKIYLPSMNDQIMRLAIDMYTAWSKLSNLNHSHLIVVAWQSVYGCETISNMQLYNKQCLNSGAWHILPEFHLTAQSCCDCLKVHWNLW